MENKRPKLPRGLRWHEGSQYIWFTWRDARGTQHQKSTETNDPARALLFKLQFLEEQKQHSEEQTPHQEHRYVEEADLKKEPLKKVAALYFEWKAASSSATTIAREQRIFKNVEKFFGASSPVRRIQLHQIRGYQKERRTQISPTMKEPVTARSVNYEMQLLRAVLSYADCWTDHLAARYHPLRQIKRRVGKVATKVCLHPRASPASPLWPVLPSRALYALDARFQARCHSQIGKSRKSD